VGDYKKNPIYPFEIKVPNKIRKRITLHEKDEVDDNITKRNNLKNQGIKSTLFNVGLKIRDKIRGRV